MNLDLYLLVQSRNLHRKKSIKEKEKNQRSIYLFARPPRCPPPLMDNGGVTQEPIDSFFTEQSPFVMLHARSNKNRLKATAVASPSA